MVSLAQDGYLGLPWDADVARWAEAARIAAQDIDFSQKRHGNTWFVGVDALPNAPDGSIQGVALGGAWRDLVNLPQRWHRAQLSVVYPGYPGRDEGESDAAFRFRKERDAAHLDGLLPEGPARRRHLREPHGFILGLPLSDVVDSPLVVWAGSHHIIAAAFRKAFNGIAPDDYGDEDVTEVYREARRAVFERCPRVEVPARLGEATLLHRHLIHGVAPWGSGQTPRPIAYFRPLVDPAQWLSPKNGHGEDRRYDT